jgi:hypothetical protein
MILELMNKYSFDFPRLKELLSGKLSHSRPFCYTKSLLGLTTDRLPESDLEVSFSKVKYKDIAPKVGLAPNVRGTDIPAFEMFCARLPKSVFSDILVDLQVFSWQYGPLSMHADEKARARFLSAYFNRIVALFSGLLFNTPMTTKDRIKYQFTIYGGVTVVFIQVKLNVGSLAERLNYYAQVIAECDGEFRMLLVKTLS